MGNTRALTWLDTVTPPLTFYLCSAQLVEGGVWGGEVDSVLIVLSVFLTVILERCS